MGSWVAFLWLACGAPEQTPAVEEVAAPPPTWAERFALVRGDLDQLRAAHQAKDQAACLRQWELAYEEHFEPLIEVPIGDREPQVVTVEYGFGRLRAALDSPRPDPTAEALTALTEALAALEQRAGTLPPPAP